MQTYVVGTYWKHLAEMLPMSTHMYVFARKNKINKQSTCRYHFFAGYDVLDYPILFFCMVIRCFTFHKSVV